MSQTRELFVNIPVRDLKREMAFFRALGFEFNPQFTDDKAACLVLGGNAYFMLLTEAFFKTFARRDVADPSKLTGAIFALSCQSRAEVDALADKALASGGSRAGEPQDHGFMYGRSFYDPEGHHFEVLWMDPKAAAPH